MKNLLLISVLLLSACATAPMRSPEDLLALPALNLEPLPFPPPPSELVAGLDALRSDLEKLQIVVAKQENQIFDLQHERQSLFDRLFEIQRMIRQAHQRLSLHIISTEREKQNTEPK